MSAPAELFLLAAAPDLVDDLGAEAHDVEGVEEGDGGGQLVADRVGISPERVQGGVFDGVDELLRPLTEPAAAAQSNGAATNGR